MSLPRDWFPKLAPKGWRRCISEYRNAGEKAKADWMKAVLDDLEKRQENARRKNESSVGSVAHQCSR